jgi:peptidoglycan/LPS O-acetylase OafA/YrhL
MRSRVFYPELESLRGAAAFSVMMLHIILIGMFIGVPNHSIEAYEKLPRDVFFLGETGIAFFNGRSAITLFFVLSAFVMSANIEWPELSFGRYATFVARRLFRIMPALWVAITFALITIPHHYSLFGLFKAYTLLDVSPLVVTWTLVLELAMCLIFPILVVATRHMGNVAQVAMALALMWIMRYAPPPLRYGQVYYDWPLLAFYLGLVVPTLGRMVILALSPTISRGLLVLALLAYISPDAARTIAVLHPDWSANWGLITEVYLQKIALPLACFYGIAWILYGSHSLALAVLNSHPLRFLGRISYSVYIFHPPVLGLFAIHLSAFAPTPYFRLLFAMATVIPVTLVLATLSYHFVELPGINTGKRLIALARSYFATGGLKFELGNRVTEALSQPGRRSEPQVVESAPIALSSPAE